MLKDSVLFKIQVSTPLVGSINSVIIRYFSFWTHPVRICFRITRERFWLTYVETIQHRYSLFLSKFIYKIQTNILTSHRDIVILIWGRGHIALDWGLSTCMDEVLLCGREDPLKIFLFCCFLRLTSFCAPHYTPHLFYCDINTSIIDVSVYDQDQVCVHIIACSNAVRFYQLFCF